MSEYETREAVLKLAEHHPEYAKHLETNEPLNMPWHDLSQMRMRPPIAVQPRATMVSIPMRDGFQSEALVFKAGLSSGGKSALVVLIYGGGFIAGAKEDMAPLAEALCDRFGATVVCLSYRLAPEYKFPTGPNDVWDGFTWAAANATMLGASPEAGFIIGGPSAGANLAAVTAQKAADANMSPALTGAYLSVPNLITEEIVPQEHRHMFLSREQNSSVAILDSEGLEHVARYYGYDPKSPDYSPFNSSTPHKEMPPVYVQVCGQDPLRDDGLIYERILRAHGVKTRLDVYPGVPHGFWLVWPQWSISQRYDRDVMAGFSWLLGKS